MDQDTGRNHTVASPFPGLDTSPSIKSAPLSPRSTRAEAPSPPQSPRDHQSTGPSEKNFSDGSGALFSMYLERAGEVDRQMTENWKGDADGIIVFTGLFSAAVATFLGNTYQNLQLNPQDASAFYLAHLYQRSAAEDGTSVSIPPSLSDPSTFAPSTTAVWVNILLFLSLVISLTCALLATMVQQWARRYLRSIHTSYQPYKRARIRSLYAEGVEKFRVSWAVEALPALLHLSVFLFYAGLVILLSTLNLAVFGVIISWVALCASLYLIITVMPVIFLDSPYHTPLSSLTWSLIMTSFKLVLGAASFVLRSLHNHGWAPIRLGVNTHALLATCQRRLRLGMVKEAEEVAMGLSSDIDSRALAWTYDSLDEDHELEQFLAGIPDFFRSTSVEKPEVVITNIRDSSHRGSLLLATVSLINRSLSHGHPTEPAQQQRFEVCVKAAFNICAKSFAWLQRIGSWRDTYVDASDQLRLYGELSKAADQDIALLADCMAARTVHWSFSYELSSCTTALEQRFGVSRHTLQEYLESKDAADIQLVNLLHFVEHVALRYSGTLPWSTSASTIDFTLSEISRIDIRNTSSELRARFCRLWNLIVTGGTPRGEQSDDQFLKRVLAHLAAMCLKLHQGTASTPAAFSASTSSSEFVWMPITSYPMCTEDTHGSSSSSYSPLESHLNTFRIVSTCPQLGFGQARSHDI
ncbi:hypothetical protein BC834DRAFT_970694 [Gloeopeniophorella convolvens]|nr:hypothetical protein BC834DRAFT_970694 [Gloeopeniophorella convolvens]